MTPLPFRTLTADDLDGAWRLLENAFGGANHPADRSVELDLVDPGRFYGAYDGDQPVAVGGSFALTMTVPGVRRPVAGVTWVGVAPTHRRRGLLTGLMRRQLDDLHEAGEAVASLWASEGAIYQRFGYGPAAWDLTLSVPTKSRFNREVPAGGMRLTAPDAAVLAPVHDAVMATRGGWTERDKTWWAFRLHDPEHRRNGAAPLLSVLADGPAGVEGYALYATSQEWSGGMSRGEARVREIVGTTPEATARLWRYLLDLDLLATVKVGNVPVDDPVLHLLTDPRTARPVLTDNVWVRCIDVASALVGRAYATEIDVVLEVADAFCPWNTGRWRLSGGPAGATCATTSDAADLSLDVRDLGAAYLGGTTLVARAAAGHVQELRPNALAAASTAFGWPGPAPAAPMVF